MGIKLNNAIIFMEKIENLVQSTHMTYIDAVVHYCDVNKVEPEIAGKMVGGKLKQNIQDEAENLHLIPRTSKLPI
jgi:hypothetical protein